jgi:hypothetical protein
MEAAKCLKMLHIFHNPRVILSMKKTPPPLDFVRRTHQLLQCGSDAVCPSWAFPP